MALVLLFLMTGATPSMSHSEHGTYYYSCVSRHITSAQLSLCTLRSHFLRTNKTIVSKESKALLPLEHSPHLVTKMGQSQTRPTEVTPVWVKPPSPRMVCALHLAEPSQRFCCHYQHFSHPERAMSYSPPYSPSLFKRPDRR